MTGNYLTGSIPKEMSIFARPGVTVKLANNFLSCCGTNPKVCVDLLLQDSKPCVANTTIDWVGLGLPWSCIFCQHPGAVASLKQFPTRHH